MAKIRLPQSRPDVGISPIPRIAPTEDTPEAALARGLYGIGSRLQQQAVKADEEDIRLSLTEVGDASSVLNEDGSLNYEETIIKSSALARDPQAGITEILGEDRARRLASDPRFSETTFRQQMSKKADESTAALSVQGSIDMSRQIKDGEFQYGDPQAIEDLRDKFNYAETLIGNISDPNAEQQALDALNPRELLRGLEVGAKKISLATEIMFYADVNKGNYDFLGIAGRGLGADKMLEALKKIQADTANLGFYEIDYEAGTANPTDTASQLSEALSHLTPELRGEANRLMDMDQTSKAATLYLFSPSFMEITEGVAYDKISDIDMTNAIRDQFLPTVHSMQGVRQREYIRSVASKAFSSTSEVPEALSNTLHSLAFSPETSRNAILALMEGTLPDKETPGHLVGLFPAEVKQDMRILLGYMNYIRKTDPTLNDAQVFRASQEIVMKGKQNVVRGEELELAKYEDPEFEFGQEFLNQAMGEGIRLTSDQKATFTAIANRNHYKLMRENPDLDLLNTGWTSTFWDTNGTPGSKYLSSKYASEVLSATWMPFFNRAEKGFSKEFLDQTSMAGSPAMKIGEAAQGAVLRTLSDVGYKGTLEDFVDHRFTMVEAMFLEDAKGNLLEDPEIKVLVTVQTKDGNILGINESGKYESNMDEITKPLTIVLSPSDFTAYGSVATGYEGSDASGYLKRLADKHHGLISSGSNNTLPSLKGLVRKDFKRAAYLFPAGTNTESPDSVVRKIIDRDEYDTATKQLEEELGRLNSPEELFEWASKAMVSPRKYFKMTKTDEEIRKQRDWIHWGYNWFDMDPYKEPYEERNPIPPSFRFDRTAAPGGSRELRWGLSPKEED